MQTKNDTSKPKDSTQEKTGEGGPEATCSASFTPRDTQQALGPHRPRTRVLASMLDTIPAHYEIEEIVVNGQTGKLLVVCWDGKGTTYRQFNSLPNEKAHAPLTEGEGRSENKEELP